MTHASIARTTRTKRTLWLGAVCMLAAQLGCGASAAKPAVNAATARSASIASGTEAQDQAQKCQGEGDRHEVSEYDTSGDDRPDVRKVFLRVGDGSLARLVLVCRESDLNSDGSKDVVRYYTDEGRPLREEADRNFDGRMDELTLFQEGLVLRQELDANFDGKVDTKIFFDAGKALRSERDMAGRSTADHWQPDRWEYYENGHVVRMGTDVDGDGKVDRWDRDVSIRRGSDLSAAPATNPA
jgi:hypothetical protein